MEKITLQPSEEMSFAQYFGSLCNPQRDVLLGETLFGHWKNQIVPSVYFRQNEFFKTKFSSVIPGIYLKLVSTVDDMYFLLEAYKSPFYLRYDVKESKFSTLLLVKRSDITRFEMKESLLFMASNPKKSLKFISDMGAFPGGIIPTLIVTGAVKLAEKYEDDLVEKNGTLFSLYFIHENTEKRIDLVCDSFYVNILNNFLTTHWIETPPVLPVQENKKKEGCFVATACFNNYCHPVVLDLRWFRDNILLESKFGNQLVSYYYEYSPNIAEVIRTRKSLRILVRTLIIYPIHFLVLIIQKFKLRF